jgi:hypothetical protein
MFILRSIFGYFVLINLFFSVTAYTQQLSDEISSKMSESDKKKLNKTDELRTKGELVLSDVGYMGDADLLDRLNNETKEFKKLLTKRVEAGGYFKESHATKYELYAKYINNFWKNFTGNKSALDNIKKRELTAIDSFKYAQTKRKESDKKSKYTERVPLLINAENIEKNALNDLEKVLVSYFYYPTVYNSEWFSDKPKEEKAEAVQTQQEEKTITETEAQPISIPQNTDINKSYTNNDTSLYTAIDVNEDQIDMFNKFLQKTYPDDYEKYIIDFQKLDYSDIEQLKAKWYSYKFPSSDTTIMLAVTDTQEDSKQLAETQNLAETKTEQTNNTERSDVSIADATESVSNETAAKKWKEQRTKEIKGTAVAGEEKSKPYNKKTVIPEATTVESVAKEFPAAGFLYKVQIAACRVTLEPQILKSLYTDSENVTETFEDNWYKYTVGEFATYQDARKIRDQVDVPGAFVVAYLNGKRIRITPSNLYGKQSMDYIIPANINPKLIEYKIQIAASKYPLSHSTLQKIYSGPQTIETRNENGWYKYVIHAGNTLRSARDMVNQINVPEAFMVTYYQNEKINLITAIRLTKNN